MFNIRTCDAGHNSALVTGSDLLVVSTRQTMTATILSEVASERLKQIKKWGDGHDDTQHNNGDLLNAAYAVLRDKQRLSPWPNFRVEGRTRDDQLRIAAALIIAEIERLRRHGPDDVSDYDGEDGP